MSNVDKICGECPLSEWSGDTWNCRWCDGFIESARRRTWCSDKCRRAFERNHVWRRARAYAKRRAKYVCQVPGCMVGGRGLLDVHHLTPRNGGGYGVGCHAHQEGLMVLCKEHHRQETRKEQSLRLTLPDKGSRIIP